MGATFSTTDLLSADGRKEFDAAMAGLIRSDRHDDADRLLAGHLAAVPAELARLCLSLPAREIAVEGWEQFNTQIEVHSSRGEPITAVGVDITDQGDATDAAGRREQLLETSYYNDRSGFAFSAADRQDILAASAGGATPRWVGGFAEIDDSLTVSGLAPLYDLLLQRPERLWSYMANDADRLENLASYLAGWTRHLRVHQAIKRGLLEHGLARKIPLIVGTNEVSPYFYAVYYPKRVGDYRAAASQSIEAKQRAHRAAYAQHTEDQIAQWREQREAIRSWSPRVNPDKRQTYIEYVKASEKLARLGTPLVAFEASYNLSDGEFERMVAAYRHHRDPSAPPPPLAPALPASQTTPRRLFGFGRRGL
jgi:hypothetical protein